MAGDPASPERGPNLYLLCHMVAGLLAGFLVFLVEAHRVNSPPARLNVQLLYNLLYLILPLLGGVKLKQQQTVKSRLSISARHMHGSIRQAISAYQAAQSQRLGRSYCRFFMAISHILRVNKG